MHRTGPVEYLDEEQLFLLFMVDLLRDRLHRATDLCNAIQVLLQVLTSLYYMACGSFQRVLADSSDINHQSAEL